MHSNLFFNIMVIYLNEIMRRVFYLYNLDDSLKGKPIVRSEENIIDFKFHVVAPEATENQIDDLILENQVDNIPERVLDVINIPQHIQENVIFEYIESSINLNNNIIDKTSEKENAAMIDNQGKSNAVKKI